MMELNGELGCVVPSWVVNLAESWKWEIRVQFKSNMFTTIHWIMWNV